MHFTSPRDGRVLLFSLRFIQNAHKRVIIIIDLYCNKTIYECISAVLSGRCAACPSTASQTIHNSSQHKYINKCKYMPSRLRFKNKMRIYLHKCVCSFRLAYSLWAIWISIAFNFIRFSPYKLFVHYPHIYCNAVIYCN